MSEAGTHTVADAKWYIVHTYSNFEKKVSEEIRRQAKLQAVSYTHLGLAIHSATGDDVARLGSRASAGCVHLAPENAAMLYELIRANYRGAVPRFAYNYDTQTMSNTGDFMHRRDGSLKMADGYRVLVVIEDYGGDNVMAALD